MILTPHEWQRLKTPSKMPPYIRKDELGRYRFFMIRRGKNYFAPRRNTFQEALEDKENCLKKLGIYDKMTRTIA